ncbi:MAG: tyrosine-type recombinase/integrase [Chloroflexi bacterium]|nr:tyrosine-type recombinase/integrase [Chloroflexota bacterium]
MISEQLTILKENDLTSSSLSLAFESFLLDAKARRLSPRTLRFYQQQLQPFLKALAVQGILKPGNIQPYHIRAYLVTLQQRGLASASVHAAARGVRSFCNFMLMEGMLERNPMRRVRMPQQDQPILPAFSPQEVKRLLAACKYQRDETIVLFLLDTGCRASEFVALNIEDIDIKSGIVRIRHGKGRKQRVAFLGNQARKMLIKHLMQRGAVAAADPLWLSMTTGKRLTIYGLQMLTRSLRKATGIKHCHPHTFRRTFALWSLRAGMNIYALQQIMGHSDLQVLRRYLALVQEDLQDAHQRFGAVDTML